MAATSSDWKDQVYLKLSEVFSNDIESFVRVQFYLDQEENAYKDSGNTPPSIRTLKMSLTNEKIFKTYAKRLADDTKRAENDEQFRTTMALMWSRIMEVSETGFDESKHQCFDLAKLSENHKIQANWTSGFTRAWAIIPQIKRAEILQVIQKVVKNEIVLRNLDKVIKGIDKLGGTVVMVTLAAVNLAYDVIKNIRRWWKGEISGKRCLKNIIDSGVCIGAGVGGGMAGAAVGSILGPWGTLAGGVIGGIAAGQAANFLIDRLTQKIFCIPKEEALENAYNFFKVPCNASNNEVNTAFRRLCLKHHPDKGGKEEDFHFVQYHMATIKAARGELY